MLTLLSLRCSTLTFGVFSESAANPSNVAIRLPESSRASTSGMLDVITLMTSRMITVLLREA